VISTETDTVLTTMPTGTLPWGVAVSR